MIDLVVAIFKLVEITTGRKSLANKTSMKMAQLDTKYDGSKVLNALEGWEYENIEKAIERTGKAYLASA